MVGLEGARKGWNGGKARRKKNVGMMGNRCNGGTEKSDGLR